MWTESQSFNGHLACPLSRRWRWLVAGSLFLFLLLLGLRIGIFGDPPSRQVPGAAARSSAPPRLIVRPAAASAGDGSCEPGTWRACPYCLPSPQSLDRGSGRQVCTTRTWDLVCQDVERQTIDLPGDDPRFFHEHGAETPAHGWSGSGAGGFLQYGPRSSLPAGPYRVEFTGQAQDGARLDFDVKDATTGRVLAQGLGVTVGRSFRHLLYFDSPAGCHRLELRVRHLGGPPVELRRTLLVPLPPVPANVLSLRP